MKPVAENQLLNLSLSFSKEIVLYHIQLKQWRHYWLADQILRAGTSIGAQVFEAQHAESRKDFIHKLKIAAKEANECYYWLKVVHVMDTIGDINMLENNLNSIIRLLSKIIQTSTLNLTKR